MPGRPSALAYDVKKARTDANQNSLSLLPEFGSAMALFQYLSVIALSLVARLFKGLTLGATRRFHLAFGNATIGVVSLT